MKPIYRSICIYVIILLFAVFLDFSNNSFEKFCDAVFSWGSLTCYFVFISVPLMAIFIVAQLGREKSIFTSQYALNQSQEGLLQYYLPETVLNLNLTTNIDGAGVVQDFTSALTADNISQVGEVFNLKYHPSRWFEDKLDVQLNASGLLSSVSVNSTSKTEAALDSLSELSTFENARAGEQFNVLEEKQSFKIKADDLAKSAKKTLNWNIKSASGSNLNVVVTIEELGALKSTDNSTSTLPDFCADGIITHPLLTKQYRVSCASGHASLDDSFLLRVVDCRLYNVIPFHRTLFGAKTQKLEMDNGLVISHQISSPSSVDGYATLPKKVVDAMVSIPARFLSIRIDLKSNELDNKQKLKEIEKDIRELKLK